MLYVVFFFFLLSFFFCEERKKSLFRGYKLGKGGSVVRIYWFQKWANGGDSDVVGWGF